MLDNLSVAVCDYYPSLLTCARVSVRSADASQNEWDQRAARGRVVLEFILVPAHPATA